MIDRERADQKQSRLDSLYMKLQQPQGSQPKGGDPQSGGVAGAFAPQAPATAAPAQPVPTAAPNAEPVMAPSPAQQSFMQQHGATIAEIMGIDPQQGAALVTNFSKLDEAQRARVKQTTDFMGQAVMDVSRLPEAQRASTWAAYVQQAEAGGMDIPTHYETYSPNALRSAAAEAGVMKELLAQFDPKYVNVVPGTDAVNVNPRAAMDPFNPSPVPTPPASPDKPSREEYGRFVASLPAGAREAAWRAYDSGELDALPTGSPVAPRGRSNAAQLKREAADAIARGADPTAVNARLRQMGVQ